MAECTSDFSKILKLQEVQTHYDDLKQRHAEELATRDREIRQLRDDASVTTQTDSTELESLRAENERLAEQFKLYREEYETKVERLSARIKSLQAQSQSAGATHAPGSQESSKKGGFFRR